MSLQAKPISIISLLVLNSLSFFPVFAQTGLSAISNNSGGVLTPEQAAYGTATIPVPTEIPYAVDPNDWILKAQKPL